MKKAVVSHRLLSLSLAVFCIGLTSCTSAMSKLNRRPFADKVGFVALQPGPYKNVESAGKFRADTCKKVWFGFIQTGDPTYEELREELIKEKNYKYLTDVTSLEYGDTGIIWGNTCIGFEGEAYR